MIINCMAIYFLFVTDPFNREKTAQGYEGGCEGRHIRYESCQKRLCELLSSTESRRFYDRNIEIYGIRIL